MGMSMFVVGIKPMDETYKKMKEIYNRCTELKIEIPEKVFKFFGYEEPDESGVIVKIPHRDYQADMEQGFEVDTKDIPEDVKIIRFYCSW